VKPLEIVKDFVCGVAYIRRVVSFGLRNTELLAMFGEKQDPYVCFSVKGPGGVIYWAGETPVLNDQGGDVIWDYLDLKLDVTRDNIEHFNLDVIVKDKNTVLGDKIIGVGTAPLVTVGSSLNTLLELPIDLKIEKKGKLKEFEKSGKLICYIELKLPEEKVHIFLIIYVYIECLYGIYVYENIY
jgi:hypothetical protein